MHTNSSDGAPSTQTFSMPRGGKTKTKRKIKRKLSRKNKGGKRRTRRKRAGQPFGASSTPANPNTSMGRMLNDYATRGWAERAAPGAGHNNRPNPIVYTEPHYGYNPSYPQSASYHTPVTVTAQGTYFGRPSGYFNK